MGGSSSTRRVVVEETDGSGVVKISDSVVKRIRGLESGNAHGSGEMYSSLPPPTSYQTESPKIYKPSTTPTEKDVSALQELEAFYVGRLKQLEERTCELQKITNDQFIRAVQEVEQKFLKHTCSPVCQDLQAKVYECYCASGGQTLNCSAEVRAFSSCVERARQNALIRKSQTC